MCYNILATINVMKGSKGDCNGSVGADVCEVGSGVCVYAI